jgi:hypothetical protein
VSDRHVSFLRAVASRWQRQLAEHDAKDARPDAASAARRRTLARTAARTKARLLAAEDRRRLRPGA